MVSDQHGGLVKAVETQFQEVLWQRCQTNFTRNILDACPKQLQSQLHSQLRVIWEAPDVDTTRKCVNEEVRRRERVIRIFPNVESAKRLLEALLMEKDEAWSTGRQYFNMRLYVEWKQEQTAMITNELQQAAAAAC